MIYFHLYLVFYFLDSAFESILLNKQSASILPSSNDSYFDDFYYSFSLCILVIMALWNNLFVEVFIVFVEVN